MPDESTGAMLNTLITFKCHFSSKCMATIQITCQILVVGEGRFLTLLYSKALCVLQNWKRQTSVLERNNKRFDQSLIVFVVEKITPFFSETYISNDETRDSNTDRELRVINGLVEHIYTVEHVREIFLQAVFGLIVFGRFCSLVTGFVEPGNRNQE